MIWGERWEGGSGLGTHVHPWRIHVNVWQNQYSIVKQTKVKIKIAKKKKGNQTLVSRFIPPTIKRRQIVADTNEQAYHTVTSIEGFPGGSVVESPPATAGDAGLIPGEGRSLGEGYGNPLQYSCL